MLKLLFKQLFRTASLLSTHRLRCSLQPSGAWDTYFGDLPTKLRIQPDIGLLFDDLYLALSHSSPPVEWYTYLLATRDSLYHFWITHPKSHTKGCTLMVTILSNGLAIADIRFLAVRNSLIKEGTAFSPIHTPYVYFNIKYKGFK